MHVLRLRDTCLIEIINAVAASMYWRRTARHGNQPQSARETFKATARCLRPTLAVLNMYTSV